MADTVGYFIKQHAIPKNANKNTKRSYKQSAERFQEYCSQVAHISLKQMRGDNAIAVATIQSYSDVLQSEGKSPDTIHTYLAPVCKAFEIPMNDILKPRRRAGKITRSGRDKDGSKLRNARGTREAAMERYSRSVALADATGIRASELAHLTVASLVEDESGHLCVEVNKGKGGKHQLQRILPAHQETVRQIFAQASSTGGGKVLGKSEINKNIDYHGRRAIVAQEAYRYYLARLQADPAYRQQLQRELLARWEHEQPARGRKYQEFAVRINNTKPYRLRGDVRDKAKLHGLPIEWDRTAILAVSVFHLSHWRENVTIKNYLVK